MMGDMSPSDARKPWFDPRVRLPRTIERHGAAVVTVSAVLPLLLCLALSTVRGSVTAATAVLCLVLLVIAAASTGIRVAGILAALSGGVWFDFFLTKPYLTFTINERNNLEAAVLLVVIGVAVTEVALWGHRQQAQANRRAGYLDGVLGTAEIVTLRGDTPQALTTHVADQIRQVLGVTRCRFAIGPVRDPRVPVLDQHGQVTRTGHEVDVDRYGLPTDDDIALLVSRAGRTIGHFLVTSASHVARPTLEQRRVAILLAAQVGQALMPPESTGDQHQAPTHPPR